MSTARFAGSLLAVATLLATTGALLSGSLPATAGATVTGGAASSSTASGASEASAGSAASGSDVGVAVVVDYGTGSGKHPQVLVKCIDVGAGSTGIDALAQAYPATRYSPEGFVCSINGYPNDDPCTGTPAGYVYWSYWHPAKVSGTWSYAQLGAQAHTVTQGDVEGWRYEASTSASASSQSPPEEPTTGYAQLCHTPTADYSVTPVAATSAQQTGADPPSTVPVSAGGDPAVTTTTSTPASSTGLSSNPTPSTSSPDSSSASRGNASFSPPTTSAGDRSPNAAAGASGRQATALGPRVHDPGGGGSSDVLPLVLAMLAVLALAGATIWRFRRRSRPS